eukprot:140711-Prorocentrum_minimum.AAC.6
MFCATSQEQCAPRRPGRGACTPSALTMRAYSLLPAPVAPAQGASRSINATCKPAASRSFATQSPITPVEGTRGQPKQSLSLHK